MPLPAEQIKTILATHITQHARAIARLSLDILSLRQQPIQGSRELKRRLAQLEHDLTLQEARLAALQELQTAIRIADSLSPT